MGKNVFMTGATGFLGRNLLEEMLTRDQNASFYVLSRSDGSTRSLKERFMFESPDRLQIVEGDITKPFMGISGDKRRELAGKIDEVWHNAASTSFDDRKADEIEAINVSGTQNVMDTVAGFKKLEDFIVNSTAYVYGLEKGEVLEEELKNGRDFKNAYERSKLTMESRVRKSNLPFTIIRPSIIMGDSRTKDSQGETRMVYGYLLATYYSALKDLGRAEGFLRNLDNFQKTGLPKELDVRLYGHRDVTRNLIAIDDVVNVSLAIREDPTRGGKTYNLVNERNITVGDMLDSIQNSLGISGYRFAGDFIPKSGECSPAEETAYRMTGPFHPYVSISEPGWQTDNVKALGVSRVPMSKELFQGYMDHFVKEEIVRKLRGK